MVQTQKGLTCGKPFNMIMALNKAPPAYLEG